MDGVSAPLIYKKRVKVGSIKPRTNLPSSNQRKLLLAELDFYL